MSTSLLKELRFKIGEQYELNEFYLKCLESTFSNGLEYENYEYIKGDFKTLFGLKLVSNIILRYNGDLLSEIIYKLDLKDFDNLVEKLNYYLSFDRKLDTGKVNLGQTITINSFQEFNLMLYVERDLQLKVFKTLG